MNYKHQKVYWFTITTVVVCCLLGLMIGITKAEAKAGEFTAGDWIKYCTAPNPSDPGKDRYEQDMVVYCNGYFEATVTTLVLFDKRLFCLPKEVTPLHMMRVTFEWLKKHEDQKKYLAAGVIAAAVAEKWPCK